MIHRTLKGLLTLAALATSSMAGAVSSYCTGIYAAQSTGALAYFNPVDNSFQAISTSGVTSPNALALNTKDGTLFYANQSSRQIYKFDRQTKQSTLLYTSQYQEIGGTFGANGIYYMLGPDGYLDRYDPSSNTYGYTAFTGATLNSTTNGDITVSPTGQAYAVLDRKLADGTVEATLYKLDLSSAVLSSPVRLTYNGANFVPANGGVNGLAVDPVTGTFYISTTDTTKPGIYSVNTSTGTLTLKTSAISNVVDLATCPEVPDTPAISKGFSPTAATALPATTTLTLTIGNTNKAEYYTYAAFTDTMPAGMTVDSFTTTCPAGKVTGTSTSLTLAANTALPVDGCTITARVRVTATGVYTNTVAAGDAQTSVGNNVAASATFTVSPPSLSLTKTLTGSLAVGSTATYTLAVTNAASSVATMGTLSVVDQLPAGVGISGLSGQSRGTSNGVSWTCTYPDESGAYQPSGQPVTCTGTGTLATGATSTFTLPVIVAPDAASSVTNFAAVGGGGDPYNSGVAPTPGSACTNMHCASSTNAVTAAPTAPATCATGATTNLLSGGTLSGFQDNDTAAATTTVPLAVNAGAYTKGVGAGGAFIVDMDWAFNNGVGTSSNVATLTLYVNGTAYAQLATTSGYNGLATITASNGATVSTTSLNRNRYAQNAPNSYALLKSFVTLPASVTGVSSVEVRYQPNAGGTSGQSDDFAYIIRALNGCNPGTDVQVTKVGPASIVAGGTVTYTITLKNAGVLAASNVKLTDTLPAGVTFVSASPAATSTNGTLTWPPVATLAVNATASYTVVVTAPSSAAIEGGVKSFTNTAQFTSDTPDTNAGNNAAQAQTNTVYVKLSKLVRNVSRGGMFALAADGKPGETLEYCISAQNLGGGDARGLTLRDAVPANTAALLDGYGAGLGVLYVTGGVAAGSGTPTGTALTSSSADTDSASLSSAGMNVGPTTLAAGAQAAVCFRASIK
ncbi:DUF11 domain-containing protein [Deinococcus maricopensis]|uniref:Conserved repeat domain protein n=1 Tax=Deinococcus maricopensis (strain DSM 21211 / LMG 22137 / NRRL B-23946 / LB-34) TaxID=709986 RepID=E8U6C0_DEIML|nr:DUF11 domain-containing protein [Deinococcus maricopensis]ADV66609.1 conserved repeat domain protein [Deinococcus maricopensis DSM 21211]